MSIKLTVGERDEFIRLLRTCSGRGGFQSLIRFLWYLLDEASGEMELDEVFLERINRYAFRYGNSRWRKSLRRIFRRTLGANLDRGLTLR